MPQFKANNLEGRDRLGHIEEYIGTNKSDWFNRTQLSVSARGLISESIPVVTATAQSAIVASDTRSALVGLREGDVVSAIWCNCVSLAASAFVVQGGVWSSAGTLLASSADSGTYFTSLGSSNTMASMALSSAFTAPADGGYYVGIWVGGSGQGPTLAKTTIPGGASGAIGSGVSASASAGSRPSIGNVTWGSSGSHYWFGVS